MNYPSDGTTTQIIQLKIKIAEIIASDTYNDIEKLALILKEIKK